MLSFSNGAVNVMGRQIKYAHAKALVAAGLTVACLLGALIVGLHIVYVSRLADEYQETARRRVDRRIAAKAERNTFAQEFPVVLGLVGVSVVTGILTIRFFNQAKSEFGSRV